VGCKGGKVKVWTTDRTLLSKELAVSIKERTQDGKESAAKRDNLGGPGECPIPAEGFGSEGATTSAWGS